MLSIYVFSLVLAGAFLLVSVFGDVFDADGELELDADVDADVADALEGSDSTHATRIFSIRTVVYALFGFGAVGTILSFRDTGALQTVLLALLGGALTGTLVTVTFNWLRATDMGDRVGDEGFVGLTGSVVLPLRAGAAGRIAVERGGRRTTLRALPHGTGEDVGKWHSVVIVEMKDGVARVAPVEEDLLAES